MTRALTVFGAALLFAFPVHAFDAARAPTIVEQGRASYYSDKFQGKPTASGELHDQNALTAASRVLPLGSTATVTNLDNGKSVDVEITDRGPYAKGHVIDLSRRAAVSIGIGRKQGTAPVRVEAVAAAQPTQELRDQVAAVSAKRAVHAKPAGHLRR